MRRHPAAVARPAAPERTLDPGLELARAGHHQRAGPLCPARLVVTVVADDAGRRAAADRASAAPACATSRSSFSRATPPTGARWMRWIFRRYQHIIMLCYSDRFDAQQADARTLITLLHLRDIGSRAGRQLLHRQRDARQPQPQPGRGHPGRRLHRQRPPDQPDAGPGRREQGAQRGLCRPVRPGGRGDLSAARRPTTCSQARRSISTPSSRRPGGAARSPSAIGGQSTAWTRRAPMGWWSIPTRRSW